MFPANRCFHVVRRRRFFFAVSIAACRVCSDMLLLTVVAIVFVAALVHSTLGFGTALVAMPMLVALLDVNVATPLVGLTMLTTIALLLVRTWRDLDVRAALHLLVASIPGIPLGLLVLRYAPQDAFRAGLGFCSSRSVCITCGRRYCPGWSTSGGRTCSASCPVFSAAHTT